MEDTGEKTAGANEAVLKQPFRKMIEAFDRKIDNYKFALMKPKIGMIIIDRANEFAADVTNVTGIEHTASVQFSEDYGMVQITVKSKYDDLFCFIRKGDV